MADEQPDFSKMSPQEVAEYQKSNCIFCKIIAGEIPSKKVYEDKDFFAILDINPVAKGHVLLLPKEHVQVMPQMNPELAGNLAVATQKISQKLITSTGCKGTTVFIANGAVAGQKAPHFLAHIIPRKNNDDVPLNPKFKNQNDDEWTQTHKKLYKAIYGAEPKDQNASKDSKEETETPENKEEDLSEKELKIPTNTLEKSKDTEELDEENKNKDKENQDDEDSTDEKADSDNISEDDDSDDDTDEEIELNNQKVDLDKIANLFK